MILNNEREKMIYQQGYMSGCNAAQTAIKAAEHRAEVAERALLTACVNLIKDKEDNVNTELLARVVYTNYLRKAKRELQEEKDDTEKKNRRISK